MTTSGPIPFQANFSCFIGTRAVVCGDALVAQRTSSGTYATYLVGEEDPLAWLNPDDLNKLAGRELISLDPTPAFDLCPDCDRPAELGDLYCPCQENILTDHGLQMHHIGHGAAS